jgi:MFS transporter, Spinster family, sphingosine-1-phosphate transporter
VSTVGSHRAWVTVGVLWLAFLINYVDRQVVFSIFPALQRDLAFDNRQLGLIGAVFLWSYSFCLPISGRLADLNRRDWLIALSLISWSLATLATGSSRTVSELLFSRMLLGVTEALYLPAAIGLIGTLHAGTTRSRALSVHGTAQVLGIILGSWYGGWMADTTGWRTAFLIMATVGMLYAPLLLFALRGLPRQATTRTTEPVSAFAFLTSATYRALALAFFCFCGLLWMIYAWLPTSLYERFNLSMTESGLAATLYLQTSSAVGAIFWGFLSDRWAVVRPGARVFVLAGLILAAGPFAYLTIAAPSLALLKLCSAAFGFFAGGMVGNIFGGVFDIVPVGNHGIAAGTMNMIGGVAGGLGVLFAGEWKNSFGLDRVMLAAAVAAVISAAILMAGARARFSSTLRTASELV